MSRTNTTPKWHGDGEKCAYPDCQNSAGHVKYLSHEYNGWLCREHWYWWRLQVEVKNHNIELERLHRLIEELRLHLIASNHKRELALQDWVNAEREITRLRRLLEKGDWE